MTAFKHRKHGARIIEPAPHPRGEPLEEGEYYMADSPNREDMLLAWPKETHKVVYWLETSSPGPRICYEACQRVSVAERLLDTKPFSALSPEHLIEQLLKTLEAVRKQATPKPESFQGMPYVGMEVFVVAPNGKVVPVKVTEIGEINGEMSVVFGFHYKPNGQWFWTKEAAEAYARGDSASTKAKNVFLGDKS